MKVRELVALLASLPQDAQVIVHAPVAHAELTQPRQVVEVTKVGRLVELKLGGMSRLSQRSTR